VSAHETKIRFPFDLRLIPLKNSEEFRQKQKTFDERIRIRKKIEEFRTFFTSS